MASVGRPVRSALETAAIGRLNRRILPLLIITYLIAYVDRTNIGIAALQMNRDIGLSASAFGFGGAIFSLPFLLGEVPSNMAMERFGARRWIARIMITWGLVAAAMAFARGPVSFVVMRLLLGAAESGFFPGIILYLTLWYPAEHRARVIGLFMLAIPISGFIGSPISTALLGFDGLLGLRGWQWLFIVEAAPAILFGFVCLGLLTDKPADAVWLPPAERAWLIERLAYERRAVRHGGELSIWRLLRDRKVIALGLAYAGSATMTGTLSIWLPQIIKATGMSNFETGMLNAVPYVIASFAMVYWGWRSDRKAERRWHVAIPMAASALFLILGLIHGHPLLAVSTLGLAVVATSMTRGPFWALSSEWLSSNKAAVGLAQVSVIGNLAIILSTYLVGLIKEATGSFALAATPLIVFASIATVAVFALGRLPKEPAPAGVDGVAPTISQA